MGDNLLPQNRGLHLSTNELLQTTSSTCFDDDGRRKRAGNVWTASVHIITAMIGFGVLSLPWAMAQLGWIAGPTFMFFFPFITYYTSSFLADCYRSGDPVTGQRNYTYMDAIKSNLGGVKYKIFELVQCLNLFGIAVCYTITSSISMTAIQRSQCFHRSSGKNPCHLNSNPYMIAFGIVEIILSQIPDFDQLCWFSIVAAVMSFTYSTIGLGLGIAEVVETGKFRGSLTGISIGSLAEIQKVWRCFQALGNIAFAYSYSTIHIEIQDTIKSPPSEAKTMKKASVVSIGITTLFYMLFGSFGYAAFGDASPVNLLADFGFYNPYWLIDIANAAIVIHLVGAYQIYCQPLFAFTEKQAAERFPDNEFITKEIEVPIPGFRPYKLNLLRLIWRTIFVIITTVMPMVLPFSNDMVGLLGALGFWPFTVYYPVEMYIVQKNIPKWSKRWICLQILSFACLVITTAAATGSIAGIVLDLKSFKPFKTDYSSNWNKIVLN